MPSKAIFKAKLDGSFYRLLRAAYVSGFDDGYDDGAYAGADKSDEEIESAFEEWYNEIVEIK